MYLSESIQTSFVEYLYECGLNPEIGLAVEYLSWNKEQRLYMAWLRDLYHFVSKDTKLLESETELKNVLLK